MREELEELKEEIRRYKEEEKGIERRGFNERGEGRKIQLEEKYFRKVEEFGADKPDRGKFDTFVFDLVNGCYNID